MKYIYIFDYTFGRIYQAIVPAMNLPQDINDIEKYLVRHYNIRINSIEYMVSDKPLQIETIEKVK